MLSTWKNVVARRDLLSALVRSELRTQTAGTILGWLWWLVDPLIMMVIYWAVIVGILGRGADYAPYPVFVLCGLLPWKHLSFSLNRATGVLRGAEGLIKAIPFPTIVLPLGRVLTGFVCFLFGMLVLLVTALVCGRPLGATAVQLVPLLALQLVLVAGLSLAVAAIGVRVRDLSVVMNHVLRVGFYATPVIYGLDLVATRLPEPWLTVYHLNPFVLLIEGYRGALFSGQWLPLAAWPLLAAEAAILFGVGYWIYRHHDRRVIKFL